MPISTDHPTGLDRRSRRRSRRTEGQRGAVAVEFAILVPILVALLSGIITAGLGYNNTLGLSDGVREGARFGATTLIDGTWAASVQAKTIDLTYLNTGSTQVVNTTMVCTQLVKAPSTVVQASTCGLTAPAPATPASVAAGTCLVKVWAQIPVTLTFILLPSQTIQVLRQSVSLYERGTC